MQRNIFLILILAFLILPSPEIESQEVKWYSIEEAMIMNSKEPRIMIIDVYTDWCGWCKRMDAATFSDSLVASALNGDFYPVKLDAEGKEDIVIGDQTYKFVDNGRKGYHELAATVTNGRLSYPTVSVVDKEGRIINVSPGFKGPEQFIVFLDFYRTGAYRTISWEDYYNEETGLTGEGSP